MASILIRGNSWRVSVYKKGIRKTASFRTKGQAQSWAIEIEAEIISGKSRIASARTVEDAFDRYAREVSPRKKGARWEQIRLNLFKRYRLASVRLSNLKPSDIADWRDTRLTEVKPGSVKRELNLISSVMTRARREWGWIDVNPVTDVSKPSDPRPRDRRISQVEIDQVLLALEYTGKIETKNHLVAVLFLLGIETAMRLGEMTALRSQDFEKEGRYVIIRDSKNNDTRHVPLSTAALDLVKTIMDAGVIVTASVASALFRKACAKTGIEDLRFHDTRHEGLTRIAQKIGVLDLARMVGHRDPKSLMIYYNPTATEIAERLG
jgi:integrase